MPATTIESSRRRAAARLIPSWPAASAAVTPFGAEAITASASPIRPTAIDWACFWVTSLAIGDHGRIVGNTIDWSEPLLIVELVLISKMTTLKFSRCHQNLLTCD